jgi:hypothetical protein
MKNPVDSIAGKELRLTPSTGRVLIPLTHGLVDPRRPVGGITCRFPLEFFEY